MSKIQDACDSAADAVAQRHMESGDFKRALEVLASAYQHRIVRFCARRLGGFQQDAVDIAQEVFLNTYQAMPRFRAQSAVCTWIYGIAYKTCLKVLRDRSRRLRIENERPEDIRQELYPRTETDWSSGNDRSEIEAKVKAGLNKLDKLEASVLLAHYADGHTVASIASIHRVSASTVHRILRRALQRLRDEVAQQD